MIDITEFTKIMQLMRKRNKEKISKTGNRLPTRKSLDSPQNVKLLKYLFGNDGNKVLQHREFIQFLMDLHDEVILEASNLFAILIVFRELHWQILVHFYNILSCVNLQLWMMI